MKRILSLILTAVMLLSILSIGVSAVPYDECMKLDADGGYMYFTNFTTSSTDTVISFEMAMQADSEGAPKVQINTGDIIISSTSVSIGGSSANITWDDLTLKHWRSIVIRYSNGNGSIEIDGETVVTKSGASCRSSGLIFMGWPGTIYIDNIVVNSAGLEVLNLNFEDEGYYLNHKNSDSNAVRGSVPSGSYYYTPEVIPDNVEYIFNNSIACSDLIVFSGEKIAVGDIDKDGRITSKDMVILNKIVGFILYIGDYEKDRVDVKQDGKINAKDILQLAKIVAGNASVQYIESGAGASAEYSNEMKSAVLTATSASATGVDATLTLDSLDTEEYKYAVVTYMIPNSESEKNSDAANQSALGAYGNFVAYDLTCDGKFHSQTVDLSEISTWNGDTVTFRFFVAANEGDKIYVDSIIFCARTSRADSAASAREADKAGYGIYDRVVVDGLGYYDGTTYICPFDCEERVAYATPSNNSTVSFDSDQIALKATTTASSDPSIYVDLTEEGLSADTFKYLVFTYMVPKDITREGPSANIYYVCGSINVPTGGYETEVLSLTKSGRYGYYVFDLSSASNWSGDIKGLRIDFFTDAPAGDYEFIDSVAFATTMTAATEAGNKRLQARSEEIEPVSIDTAQELWNTYRTGYQGLNSDEYIIGTQTNLNMYFRYGSDDKLTARSLGDRMARALSEVVKNSEISTEVTCEVYNGYSDLKSNGSGNVLYTINYNNTSFVAWVYTNIIYDSSYSDTLDGTINDVEPSFGNTSTWFTSGLDVTDSTTLATSNTILAYHSNHETRLVKTPYGTFAVYPTWQTTDASNNIGDASFTIFRIYDDGSYKKLGTYDMPYHSSKPNIMYGDDGLVYVVLGDDQTSYASLFVAYFDPASPKSDGTYKITYGRTTKSYSGGAAPGGYGYSQPMLDTKNGKIYVMFCGGINNGYLAWFIYNYKTHSWESSTYSAVIGESYRHCYLFAYPDGADGMYIVGGRDVLLSTIGLAGVVVGADYAWDEVNLFHFKSMYSSSYTFTHVREADYSQQDRELFPGQSTSETYLTSDGYLHVFNGEGLHSRVNNDTKYSIIWHTVYDVSTPGMEPVQVYQEPITFISPKNDYTVRMVENTSGDLYILAMPNDSERDARCEIWKATDSLGTQFELVGCRAFSDTRYCLTKMIATNNRNGSITDNTISCMYPVEVEAWTSWTYKYFTVTLPE